jgi:hypothetical protein
MQMRLQVVITRIVALRQLGKVRSHPSSGERDQPLAPSWKAAKPKRVDPDAGGTLKETLATIKGLQARVDSQDGVNRDLRAQLKKQDEQLKKQDEQLEKQDESSRSKMVSTRASAHSSKT